MNFGKVRAKPQIKVGYGSSIGQVGHNIKRRTQLRMKRASVKKFGYGK